MSAIDESNSNRLSVAIVARDAAALLKVTLPSIAAIADEIIVADTGSRDDTRNVAVSGGSRVINVPWQDDFSAARNACLAECRGDWVLWLDAGECITPVTAGKLRDFVDGGADRTTAYTLDVRRPTAAGAISAEQIAAVRLVPRRADLYFQRRVNEQIAPSCLAAGLGIERLTWKIYRHPSDLDWARNLRAAQRNIALAEAEIESNGVSAHALVTCGEALMRLGENAEARRYFQEARRRAADGSNDLLQAFYAEIASYSSTGQLRKAQLDLCVEALVSFPVDLQLLCAMANQLQAEQRVDLAARTFQTAVECGQVNESVWHLADIREIAVVCHSVALQLLGRDDAAEAAIVEGLEKYQGSARIRYHLIDLLIGRRRRDEALQQASQLPNAISGRAALLSAVRGACLAAERDWVAAEAYLEGGYEAGCRDPLCLRWLALTRFHRGKTAAAQQVLTEWQSLEPENDEIAVYQERLDRQPPASSSPASTDELRDGKRLRIHSPAGGRHETPPPPNTGVSRTRVPGLRPPTSN